MDNIILAFESEKTCQNLKELLEGSGTALCLVCRSAAQVRRLVHKQRVTCVVCGYKLRDESSEQLFEDLPESCAMLLIAVQSLLDLVGNEDIFKLPAPVSRSNLIASVRLMLQIGRRLERYTRPRRSGEEQAVIDSAKALLIDRYSMSEQQAHRFLQKRSMDTGAKLIQTARMVLDETHF